jgi:hypothetical protein
MPVGVHSQGADQHGPPLYLFIQPHTADKTLLVDSFAEEGDVLDEHRNAELGFEDNRRILFTERCRDHFTSVSQTLGHRR